MTVLLAGCGGGGTGSSAAPPGVNTGVPSVVKLLPVQFIAQTNSFITLKARVLDGNGNAVANYPVSFTNMSLTGILSAVTATTNSQGNAEVRLSSTTPGFATIVAQVTAGSGIVRDRKTVYFSTNDVLATSMSMEVNSVPGNSTYNEVSDFTLFESDADDTFEVLATIFDAGGVPVLGGWGVSWGTSHAEAVVVRAETETNVYGQAKAIFKVSPTSIRDTETHVNVTAFAGNGAANMVTLFLRPVVVSAAASSLTADPLTVAPGGTSDLTAIVMLNTGAKAPDGTTVNFSTTCGTVTPFGQTTDGVAASVFTAPVTEGTCTVTAKVEGVVIGTVPIRVTQALAVFPTSATIDGLAGGSRIFTITGGNPAYSVTASNPSVTLSAVAANGTFTATVAPGTAAGAVTVQVRDSAGATVTVTITITAGICTAAAPTITVVPGVAQNISAGGVLPASVTYNLTVHNNDSAACAAATFTLTKTSDTPAVPTADFATSVLSATIPAPCSLVPGGTCTATLTHTSTAGPLTATNTLATLVTASAAGHASGTLTLTTTIVP